MSRTRIITLLLALAVVLCAAPFAEACPECKKGFSDHIARGYFWSILFMLSMPVLIITGLGSYFYWEIRRAYAREALEQSLADEAPPAEVGGTLGEPALSR